MIVDCSNNSSVSKVPLLQKISIVMPSPTEPLLFTKVARQLTFSKSRILQFGKVAQSLVEIAVNI